MLNKKEVIRWKVDLGPIPTNLTNWECKFMVSMLDIAYKKELSEKQLNIYNKLSTKYNIYPIRN